MSTRTEPMPVDEHVAFVREVKTWGENPTIRGLIVAGAIRYRQERNSLGEFLQGHLGRLLPRNIKVVGMRRRGEPDGHATESGRIEPVVLAVAQSEASLKELDSRAGTPTLDRCCYDLVLGYEGLLRTEHVPRFLHAESLIRDSDLTPDAGAQEVSQVWALRHDTREYQGAVEDFGWILECREWVRRAFETEGLLAECAHPEPAGENNAKFVPEPVAQAADVPAAVNKQAVNATQGEGEETQPPALTMSESLVLQTLALFNASQLRSAAAIAEEMDPENRLSEETVRQGVIRLIELDLAERPEGGRSGARLTPAGRILAGEIAD